jgi:stearoyl-CoA desaturase (delta-9 desaturase)
MTAVASTRPGSRASKADRARRLERRVALATVVLPIAGLTAAVALLWGRGIGPVELGLFLGMNAVCLVGMGVGFHRLVSHNSFQTRPAIRALLAILGSMAAQGPVLYWAGIHRRHHACSDREGDPHSPHGHGSGLAGVLRGWWYSHIAWMFAHNCTDWARYIPDLRRDALLLRINRLYFFWIFLGLLIPAVLGGLLTWTWTGVLLGLLWGGLVRIFVGQHTIWSIGSLCHLYGRQPFRTHDESRNLFLLSVAALGEGWHNNHHAFPYAAIHGLRWWQIDPNGWCIRGLAAVGLAWDLKAPSERALTEARRDAAKGAPGAAPLQVS